MFNTHSRAEASHTSTQLLCHGGATLAGTCFLRKYPTKARPIPPFGAWFAGAAGDNRRAPAKESDSSHSQGATGNAAFPFRSTTLSLWLFFVLVFCWSWSFWLPAAALGVSIETAAGRALMALGLLGPMLGGIGFSYFTGGTGYWREYWLRIIDLRRISPNWYLVIFLLVPVLMAIAVLIDVASEGNLVFVQIDKRLSPFLAAPRQIAPFALAAFFKGPLPEELGWRGYALDQLQTRWNALMSSLILGVIWAIWHLPLFLIKGTYHHEQSVWSFGFWLFMLGVIPLAVIFTWVFNNTRRSTLGAILFHFVANISYELANVTAWTNLYATLLSFAVALAIIACWGPRTLTRRECTALVQ